MAYPGLAAVVIGVTIVAFVYYMFSNKEEEQQHHQSNTNNTTRSRSRSIENFYASENILERDTRSKRRASNKNSDDCTICLCTTINTRNIVLPKCKHVFHEKCLRKWEYIEKSCPNCRVSFE